MFASTNQMNMKKSILTFGILFGLFFSSQAQVPTWDSFTSQDGVVSPLNDGGYLAAYDSTYTGSVFPGQAVKKVNADGSIAWTHLFKRGSYILSSVKINAIADDGNGGAIVGGQFQDVVYFGSDSIKGVSNTNKNILIARINASGKVWWMNAGGTNATFAAEDNAGFVKVKNNAVYVSGVMRSRDCSFGTFNFPKATYDATEKVFVAKMSLAGVPEWVKLTTGGPVFIKNMTTDANGNTYIVGAMTNSGNVMFDATTTVTGANQGIFVAKFTATGTVALVKSWCYYDGGAVARDIVTDANGNMFIIGFAGNFGSTFNGFTLPQKTSYLLKLNTDGSVAWWRFLKAEMGASVLTGPQGIALADTNVFVMGNFSPSGYLQSSATDSVKVAVKSGLQAVSEVYIARYTPSGILDWKETGTHDGIITNNQATGMLSSPNQSKIMIKGTFTTKAKFGSLTLPPDGTVGSYIFGFITLSSGVGGSTGIAKTTITEDVLVYPNPANADLFLSFEHNSKATIRVMDLQGRILLQTESHETLVNLNIESLTTGIYIASIETEQGISTRKFIKN